MKTCGFCNHKLLLPKTKIYKVTIQGKPTEIFVVKCCHCKNELIYRKDEKILTERILLIGGDSK